MSQAPTREKCNDGSWDFGDNPGDFPLWFGKHKGQAFSELDLGYRYYMLSQFTESDSANGEKFKALHHVYNEWYDERKSPFSQIVWFGEDKGHEIRVLYGQPKKWRFLITGGCKPENKNALLELFARQEAWLEKHPRALREKRYPVMICNSVGEKLGPRDGTLSPDPDDKYQSDDGFIVDDDFDDEESEDEEEDMKEEDHEDETDDEPINKKSKRTSASFRTVNPQLQESPSRTRKRASEFIASSESDTATETEENSDMSRDEKASMSFSRKPASPRPRKSRTKKHKVLRTPPPIFDSDDEDDNLPPISKVLQNSHTKEPAYEMKGRSDVTAMVSIIASDDEGSDEEDIVAPGSSRRKTRIGQTPRRLVKREEYKKVTKLSFED
ncbi:hypothetical protein GLAREA_08939 [Glarea lozoyensis ATCC 20868]|uniref:Uncharacterized protein n=2 Tax=Glarea lozoyensis TaxID=101852 RepID=S3DY10_GLAL2|nr:uncharacterized protein GLAREA_08939 [Glarea lozoyensis ATCC 20868]EHK99135.1 hypothetical protein M7I_4967 [Glarea lozoyensis 74030]EPE36776.1 hypothetical protein GLAREA_08939 [Glarea lozoyensis ATCC 20868]